MSRKMLIRQLLVAIFFGLGLTVQAQNTPTITLKTGDLYTGGPSGNVGIMLEILPNHSYAFYTNNDVVRDVVLPPGILSMGTYQQRNNKLYLTDRLFGFTLVLAMDSSGLHGRTGFGFMESLHLSFWRNVRIYREREGPISVVENYKELLQKKNELSSKSHVSLSKSYKYLKWRLYFETDHTYSLQINDVVISQGTWKREGNIITLYDSVLKCFFYGVLLPDGRLQSMLLPGFYRGEILDK